MPAADTDIDALELEIAELLDDADTARRGARF
jgi:hypothetical protein